MTLLHLILGGGFLALIFLVFYTVKRKAYAALGLSLGVIVAVVLLNIAAYQVQIGYDHMHMTRILRSTADAIRAGKADEVVAAYDRFSAIRTNAGITFWELRWSNSPRRNTSWPSAGRDWISNASCNRSTRCTKSMACSARRCYDHATTYPVRYAAIPDAQIKVIHSRTRDDDQFDMKVQSINHVGLLKPTRVNDKFVERTGMYELIGSVLRVPPCVLKQASFSTTCKTWRTRATMALAH